MKAKDQKRAVNQVEIEGRVITEPKATWVSEETMVVNLLLAVDDKDVNRYGEEYTRTDFFRVNIWGKLAVDCIDVVGKHDKIRIKGALRTRTYKNAEGTRLYPVEILATGFEAVRTAAKR